ncbi:hypothetical protein C7999DRAFT_41018 [Corynascus novoguineensis]|uniref:Uncharacterized protein n=1 Tax=Corynascus novoguineensis TaxID=1126955 RepID=A0AAN7HP67_9PEZI|nr:hypothetical protein C7999DRAFT_41018 [Corynascus novoguineensis]
MSAARLRLFIGSCLITRVAAGAGDDFSNNLFSDLAPLLALFGEKVTMQFMSQSMGWADNIILAVAPLGIITAVVGAIRVGGPSWLKAIIGRARESHAVAEAELMSSTSNEVCELWNGQQIVRVMGRGPICEFIILLPEEEQQIPEGQVEPPTCCHSNLTFPSEPTVRELVSGKRPRQPDNLEPGKGTPDRSVFVVRNGADTADTTAKAPNLSLNVHNSLGRGEPYAVAVFGIILQLGVLVYSGFATYYPAFKFSKDGDPVAGYAYPCTAVGTLLLVTGILLCSHVVENSTEEATYFPEPNKEARIVWLQRSGIVNDQAFGSFAIFPEHAQVLVRTSQRASAPGIRHQGRARERPGGESAKTSQSYQNATRNHSPSASKSGRSTHSSSISEQSQASSDSLSRVPGLSTFEEVKAVAGTLISICGYIVQFTGLRGMHWSASVAQLGATLLMTILRAWIRRNLAGRPRALPIVPGHELDWLAMTFAGELTNATWRNHPKDCEKWDQHHRPWADNDDWDWKTIAIQDPAKLNLKQDPTELNLKRYKCYGSGMATRLMEIRKNLGKLAVWNGLASSEAVSVARAIEFAMDALLGSLQGQFTWSLKIGDGEIHFGLVRQDKGWKAYADEIEAALSLWLYSVEKKEQSPVSESDVTADDDAWLRMKGTSAKRSLRLLDSSTQSLCRDLRWWMPDAAARVVVTMKEGNTSEDHGNKVKEGHASKNQSNTIVLEAHRVVGFAAKRRYVVQPFPGHSDEDAFKHAAGDGKAGDMTLVVESYTPLTTLFAQHIFSSFMWAVAKKIGDRERIASKVTVRPTETDGPNASAAWQSFTLHNSQLSKMAQDIQNTGLGTLEEVYLCIIPPLNMENKLPRVDATIDWTRTHAKPLERRGHWKEASDAYLWLFRTTKSFQGPNDIAVEAATLLVEFFRAVMDALELKKAQQFEERAIEELVMIKSHLHKELVSSISHEPDAAYFRSILASLMWLYQEQRRPWKKCPFDQAFGFPENKEEVLNFTEVHRGAKNDQLWSSELQGVVGMVNEKDILDWTPLHYAVMHDHQTALNTLLTNRADVNARDIRGRTPLHYACRHNRDSIVQNLLREGADINMQDIDGKAPIHHAAEEGHAAYKLHIDLVNYLQKDSNTRLRDYNGRTPLHLAVIGEPNMALGEKEVAGLLSEPQALFDARDRFARTPLHYAARNGRATFVELLLEKGAAIEAKDSIGRTPLHVAAWSGHVAAVKLLLEKGTAIEANDSIGRTPLHFAAKSGHVAAVKLLLEKGAAIEANDSIGRTPLHFAGSGHVAVVELLLG